MGKIGEILDLPLSIYLPQVVDVKLCLHQAKVNGGKRSDFFGLGCTFSPWWSFMKLEIQGDIHKICISWKIFTFHFSTKNILEHLFD